MRNNKRPRRKALYLLALIPVIRLAIIYNTNPPQFWQEAPFLIASIAAIFAGISALLTLQSLELTKATTRPFITRDDQKITVSKGQVDIMLSIRNTGALPAVSVTVDYALLLIGKEGKDGIQLSEGKLTDNSTLLPSINNLIGFLVDVEHTNVVLDEQTKLIITINYQHSITKENYQTVISSRIIKKLTEDGKFYRYYLSPINTECHWY